MGIQDVIIGIAFLLNAQGIPAAPPQTAGYATMAECEADMEAVRENFKQMQEDAPFDNQIQDHVVKAYCFEGSNLK